MDCIAPAHAQRPTHGPPPCTELSLPGDPIAVRARARIVSEAQGEPYDKYTLHPRPTETTAFVHQRRK
jgi:hypothetical protein